VLHESFQIQTCSFFQNEKFVQIAVYGICHRSGSRLR
jgi:hypothetical protein